MVINSTVSRPSKAPDYILIGHVTNDVLENGMTTIGGTASYAALTADSLGFSVGLLTSAGSDFQMTKLAPVEDIIVNPSLVTTTFKNAYIDGSRQQVVYGIANKLEPGDMPERWKAPQIAHIAPVFEECDYAFFEHFHRGTYIGVTLQGWIREKLPDGRVVPKLWKNGLDVFQKASAVVVSEDDILGDWEYAEILAQSTQLLVVTCGSRGGFIYKQNQRISFSAPEVIEQNPTGAGDIFAAAFFCAAARGQNPYAASLFASCLAAKSVTRMGLASIPTKAEVRDCSLTAPEE